MGKQEIVAQALKLNPAERFDLVDQILHSLDKPDPEIDRVWLEEAAKRLADLPNANWNKKLFAFPPGYGVNCRITIDQGFVK